jgi:hypothetical protein
VTRKPSLGVGGFSNSRYDVWLVTVLCSCLRA